MVPRTKETFIDGWVRTGDEVYITAETDVFVVDRLKVHPVDRIRDLSPMLTDISQEIIKVRGFQVAPAELEGHLLKHPVVDDCCVVGVPDEYSGELPVAFVVPSVSAKARAGKSTAEAQEVKEAIMQVRWVADSMCTEEN